MIIDIGVGRGDKRIYSRCRGKETIGETEIERWREETRGETVKLYFFFSGYSKF